MHTIILKLDPEGLENPDLDLRYKLPDLLVERSGRRIEDDGYDYARDGYYPPGNAPLLLFLKASDLEAALKCIIDVVENTRVLGNDLRKGVVVAVGRRAGHPEGDQVVYPPNYEDYFFREP
jgi:hypothetical protein